MTISISAPYPATKVTSILPDPIFGNLRATQSRIQFKRTMSGRIWTYAKPNDKENIVLTFNLSRQKDLEFSEFLRIYQTATWKIVDHNGKPWKVQLIGEPIRRTAVGKGNSVNSTTGGDIIELRLSLSAETI